METFLPAKILIVDDRPDNITVLEAVLDDPRTELVSTTSSTRAVELARDTEFALMLLDVQMPIKDGFETAREIRSGGASKNSPIIFVTANYGEEIYVNQGYESGAVDYIFKPFNPVHLKSKVAVFVDLYLKSKQLLYQSELMRETERRGFNSRLLQIKIQGLQKERKLAQKNTDLVNSIGHCLIWSANISDFQVTFMNPMAERLLGFTVDELIHRSNFWLETVFPDDWAHFDASLKEVSTDHDVSFEHRLRSKDGKVLWFNTNVRLGEKSDEGGFELRGLSVDITAQKEIQQDLRLAEESQRFLSESGACLSSSKLNLEKTITRLVKLVAPRFGEFSIIHLCDDDHLRAAAAYPPSLLFKDRWGAVVNDPDVVKEAMRMQKSEMNSHLPEFLEVLGAKFYICVPLIVGNSAIGALTLASATREYSQSDLELIEELVRRASMAIENALLYKKAEDAVHTRDEFLSIASHELRTPLTALKIQLQNTVKTINDGKFSILTPERLRKIVSRSDRQIDRLNSLIDDLLSVAKINLGRLALDLRIMDLNSLIQEIAEQFREQISSASCTLTLDVRPAIKGLWDKLKLEQVLINLLTNAIKYGNGGEIIVSAQEEADVVRICVRDHGIGIEKRDQQRIFNLFERAKHANNYGGLGLGLYIVRNIVHQHGGEIHVESEPGHGSNFILEIPRFPGSQRTGISDDKNLKPTALTVS